ncbi:MAG: hypothetical protein KDK07_07360 [Bauldia sp.]|nr:hypothetical protein [Bauldia sp.]
MLRFGGLNDQGTAFESLWRAMRSGFGEGLDVTGAETVAAGPGEDALDHPALGLHDEADIGAA